MAGSCIQVLTTDIEMLNMLLIERMTTAFTLTCAVLYFNAEMETRLLPP